MSNTLSLDRLRKGLEKLTSIGNIEEEVVVGDTRFTLRTLSANEHKAVNVYVANYMQSLEEDEELENTTATFEFFNVRKIEPLTYSIQAIGDLDLHGIDYIQITEDKKVEKHVWVREFLGSLDLAYVEVLHRKYIDILKASEKFAASKIKFQDLEEELDILEQRRDAILKELGRGEDVEESQETERRKDSAQDVKDVIFKPVEENDERFIRLDDPEKPYTEDEIEYLEEQERLLEARNGKKEDPIASKIQKARQPLNQVVPQFTEEPQGLDPEPRGGKNPNYHGR